MASSDAAIEETMEAQDVASDGESVNSDILLEDTAEKESTNKDEDKKEVVKEEVKTKEKPVKEVFRALKVYPVYLEDLLNPMVSDLSGQCSKFIFTLLDPPGEITDNHPGRLSLVYSSMELINAAYDKLEELVTSNAKACGVEPELFKPSDDAFDEGGNGKLDPKLIVPDVDSLIVYICGFPEDTTVEQLQPLFPKAKDVTLSADEHGKHTGFAVVNFSTYADARQCVLASKNLKMEENQLHAFRMFKPKPKQFPRNQKSDQRRTNNQRSEGEGGGRFGNQRHAPYMRGGRDDSDRRLMRDDFPMRRGPLFSNRPMGMMGRHMGPTPNEMRMKMEMQSQIEQMKSQMKQEMNMQLELQRMQLQKQMHNMSQDSPRQQSSQYGASNYDKSGLMDNYNYGGGYGDGGGYQGGYGYQDNSRKRKEPMGGRQGGSDAYKIRRQNQSDFNSGGSGNYQSGFGGGYSGGYNF